jgi:hypothetical protein
VPRECRVCRATLRDFHFGTCRERRASDPESAHFSRSLYSPLAQSRISRIRDWRFVGQTACALLGSLRHVGNPKACLCRRILKNRIKKIPVIRENTGNWIARWQSRISPNVQKNLLISMIYEACGSALVRQICARTGN